MRTAITNLVGLAGFACLISAGFLVALPLGLLLLGITLLLIGIGLASTEGGEKNG